MYLVRKEEPYQTKNHVTNPNNNNNNNNNNVTRGVAEPMIKTAKPVLTLAVNPAKAVMVVTVGWSGNHPENCSKFRI